jgi:bifunctional non-homologous end joining protein LigD
VELSFGDRVVKLTSTDRVVFPDCGVTKGDIIKHYADVASIVVPELRDRPLTVERFTKTIEQGGFYQKHAQKHYPAWIDRIHVAHTKPVDYPVVTDAASLIYLVNQGGFVLHVWSSRRPHLEKPDLLVLDLDPPEGRVDLAREVARHTRELLEAIELSAFIKTTGSKGFHIVAPLDGTDDYPAVHELIGAIAKILLVRHPALATQEFYKKDRAGKLFLDTGRTMPGATYVAAYSVRGRPGAPVSAPITWDELETVRPDGITLRDIPRRLAEIGDPWETLRSKPGSARGAFVRMRDLATRGQR